jgi:pyruvate/2-oxoglutarate dehydrogenase complex dihydrolipoamide dehydrogenase (E3) component
MAAENALKGNHRGVDFSLLPTSIFTIPAVAQVGLTEAEAGKQGFTVGVSRSPFEDNTTAAIRGEAEGLVKVVYDEPTGRVLGVHILGAGAEDLIHIAAVAMRGGLKRQDLAEMHHVFPTLGGAVFDAMWD